GKTDRTALRNIKKMWETAGSEVVEMDSERHDLILAAISHLPHMIAYSMVNTIADIEEKNEDILKYTAGGFKDFTRIASSSPEMWRDVCMTNKSAIVDMLELFEKRVSSLKALIEAGDAKGLEEDFTRAKGIRDSLKRQ
ncbi:MAG: prephenate dehydrogenase dimerization domain-containing protein, partial [Thermodesulfobacteriota bacterium]